VSQHDVDRIIRLQRLLGKLEQVSKQASDLGRMAAELHREAHDSIQLVHEAGDKSPGRRPAAKKRKRKRR
jgi:hypothetical protein